MVLNCIELSSAQFNTYIPPIKIFSAEKVLTGALHTHTHTNTHSLTLAHTCALTHARAHTQLTPKRREYV